MIIYFNEKIEGKGKVWERQNGLTRRTLVLIVNEKDFPDGINGKQVRGRIGWLKKGNHSFIFINKEKYPSDKVVGIFLNRQYGYSVCPREAHTFEEMQKNPEGAKSPYQIFSSSSYGGPGNSESRFGIYKVGTVIEVFTYKYRSPFTYYLLTEKGWVKMGTKADILASEGKEAEYVKKVMRWEQEIQFLD